MDRPWRAVVWLLLACAILYPAALALFDRQGPEDGRAIRALRVLRTVREAEETYRASHGAYASLDQLKAAGRVTIGERGVDSESGYRFVSFVDEAGYAVAAVPPRGSSSSPFMVDDSGAIRP